MLIHRNPGEPTRETEIKLRVLDVSALRVRLRQLRAREVSPRTYESNTLYDFDSKSLFASGQLVRVRIERPAAIGVRNRRAGSSHAVITYKGPVRPAKHGPLATKKPRYKVREEAEIVLGSKELDVTNMIRILRALGLRPVFQYEKFRTTYVLPGIGKLKVEFDETPIGLFLELEGTESEIDRAAKLLGYTPEDYIAQTYGALYLNACRKRGLLPRNMLFKPTKKMR